MANTETGWTKEFPAVDGAYYVRLAGDAADLTLVRVEAAIVHEFGVAINFREPDYEGCEWLGPISPSDAEQLAELREAARRALTWTEELMLAKPLSEQGDAVTASLRAALNPSHSQEGDTDES